MANLNFDVQRFVEYTRDVTDTAIRGRRRISGNYGRLWINGVMIFEISAFSATTTFEREDVWIGNSRDTKVTGMTGEGEFTIRQVFTRGFDELLRNQQKGYDERFIFVGKLSDPDTSGGGVETVRIENVWVNEIEIMKFEKAAIIEKTIPFGFTPEDVYFDSSIAAPSVPGVVTTVNHFGYDDPSL